ncbi:general stress protein [Planococcus shenhongbingii]|uniref:General stress protein n=1 Tax=Planococcus shenhongbingii TaxID=3058398 RepID=A0ABT8N9A0_9BACL|nr:general stress protein [Planococcus sp. N017]MDN7244457.1 general stress protein [Planococcus sp. N017]
MGSEKQVLAVVYSEKDLLNKIYDLKQQGHEESEIHVMAKDLDRFDRVENQTAAEIEGAGSFKDKFKGIFSRQENNGEGIKSLNLSESETERYSDELEKGGILLYVIGGRKGIDEVIAESHFRDREGNPVEAFTNEYVNSVDNTFDDPQDRFDRGESFQHDPLLMKEENHISFTTLPEHEKKK